VNGADHGAGLAFSALLRALGFDADHSECKVSNPPASATESVSPAHLSLSESQQVRTWPRIRIRGAEPLSGLGPLRRDLAAADHVPRPDLEDVGEVAPERDLELEPHRLHAVVGDV
jgi:hypothetical protein